MDDFLKFFAKKVLTYPMHLEVSYSKVTDWGVRVWGGEPPTTGTTKNSSTSRTATRNCVLQSRRCS